MRSVDQLQFVRNPALSSREKERERGEGTN